MSLTTKVEALLEPNNCDHCHRSPGSPFGYRQVQQGGYELEEPQLLARKFHRVLALGLSDKTGVRANFEDALAEQLAATGMETIPGNSILLRPEGTQFDLNYLKTQFGRTRLMRS